MTDDSWKTISMTQEQKEELRIVERKILRMILGPIKGKEKMTLGEQQTKNCLKK